MRRTQKALSKLRKIRSWYTLTATAQLLYYELVMINYYNNWREVFSCSNEYLCKSLNMSEKTLRRVRKTLENANLIRYYSGKTKKQAGSYSLCYTGTPEPIPEEDKDTDKYPDKYPDKQPDNKNMKSFCKDSNNDIESELEKKEKLIEEDKAQFEEFRHIYPGTKRSLETEFANLQKKYPGYRNLLPLFIPAIKRLIQWTRLRQEMGFFAPNYPALRTWINQRRWEVELPNPQIP